jgi:hypothetical protein
MRKLLRPRFRGPKSAALSSRKVTVACDDTSALFFDDSKVPVTVIPNADINSPTGLPSL